MIAEEVGIKKPSLYYFFKNKEKIYVSILEELINDIIHVFKTSSENMIPLEKTLEELFLLSKKNGPFIFSVDSLEDESLRKISTLSSELGLYMKDYLSTQSLRLSEDDIIRVILDTSQMYAQRIAQQQAAVSPAEYATLLTKLFKK